MVRAISTMIPMMSQKANRAAAPPVSRKIKEIIMNTAAMNLIIGQS